MNLFEYKNAKIYYKIIGKRGKWLLFLHGWGGSSESFAPVYPLFKDWKILTLDFPPFGNSDLNSAVWNTEDYAEMICALMSYLKIRKIRVICHSFGGRVALLLASKYNFITDLVLCDSAGIKPRFNIITKLRIISYKIRRKLKMNVKNAGSADYRALTPSERASFVKIIGYNLNKHLTKINCRTIIIWGKKDEDTPLYMAKKLHRKITGSKLIIFKNAGHFAYLDNLSEFAAITKNFLGESK